MGNPDEITIGGESLGAHSVMLQSLYAGHKGLFKGVICQSGTPLGFEARGEFQTRIAFKKASNGSFSI